MFNILINRKIQTVSELMQFIEIMKTKCKIEELDIIFAIHELAHTIFAIQEGYDVLMIDLNKEVKVDYGEDLAILERTSFQTVENELKQTYNKVITSYLLILISGNISEDVFFSKNTDYSRSVSIHQFFNDRYFVTLSDGKKFLNILREANLILSYKEIEYYIETATDRMNSKKFVSLLWKLLRKIYFHNLYFFIVPKKNKAKNDNNNLIHMIKKIVNLK